MSFLDTEPVPIHRIEAAARWSRFRISDPRQVLATLRELCRASVPLTLGLAGGPSVLGVLWAIDEQQGHLRFSTAAPAAAVDLRTLAAVPGLWAAGYLREVKLQFELRGLAPAGTVATARMPASLLSLPRRRAVRIKRAPEHSPHLRLRHPVQADRLVDLRVLDISTSGCSVLKDSDAPLLPPGAHWRQVEVLLGADQQFVTDLRIQHVSHHAATPGGARVGCEWVGLGDSAADTLQQWINRGRRRREVLSLTLE